MFNSWSLNKEKVPFVLHLSKVICVERGSDILLESKKAPIFISLVLFNSLVLFDQKMIISYPSRN